MDKRIILRDYKDNKKEFIIKDFENVEDIFIDIISGDEVAYICYKDNTEIEFDSSEDRIMNFYDYQYQLPLELIDMFSDFNGSSYNCKTYIEKLTEEGD